MFIQFSVENYRSFRDLSIFSMQVSPIKSQNESLDVQNTFVADCAKDCRLLKSAVIYGANASGKSNFIEAINFMSKYIVRSSRESQADDPISIEPFQLSTETESQPSVFEMTFVAGGRYYRYGFSVDKERVHAEWLYHTPHKRESRLFERRYNGKQDVYTLKGVIKKESDGLDRRTRSNALFLSVLSQFNVDTASTIVRWFRRLGVLGTWLDHTSIEITLHYLQDKQSKSGVAKFLQNLELGFSDFTLKRNPERLKHIIDDLNDTDREMYLSRYATTISTTHKRYDKSQNPVGEVQFDLRANESAGTQKVFALAGPIIDTLESGEALFVDELDARLHPILTRAIIHLFNSSETNPKNAQLIFATHDTTLLDKEIFRRDQIWLVEKDLFGASNMYSLDQIKGVRNDADYESGYLSGKYGAIPYISSLDDLVSDFQ